MAAAAAGVGRLEEEALRRKERLKALREKTGRKVRDVELELQAWRPVFWVRAGGRGKHCCRNARAHARRACAIGRRWDLLLR